MNDFPLTAQALLSVAGVAILAWGVTALLKPWIKSRWPKEENENGYRKAVTVVAFVTSLIATLIATVSLTLADQLEGDLVLNLIAAVLVAISATLAAMGLHETKDTLQNKS